MKFCLCIFTLLMLFCSTNAWANVTPTIPEVRSVEIYPSGARFVFAVKAPVGDVRLELPGAFDESSVRVLSPEGLEGLQAVRRSRSIWVPPALTQLKSERDAQKLTVAQLTARESSLKQTLNLLAALHPGKEQSSAGELIAYIKDAQTLKLETEDALAALRPELEAEQEKLRLLESELTRRSPAMSNSWLDVTGRVTSTSEVLFEAHTDNANWQPHYRMSLDSATGKIHAQLYAATAQDTGLDYTGAVLFHTHEPDDVVRTPRLDPLRVDLRPKPVTNFSGSLSSAMPMKQRAAGVASDMAMFEEDVEEQPMMVMARKSAAVRESITLTDRAIDGEGTLPGDGSTVQFELGAIDLTCTPEFMLIPEQQKDAWILASMDAAVAAGDSADDTGTRELIPGEAELFVDGAPAGRTNIPQYGLAQSKLPFGRVALLTATKEPLVGMTGSAWFSGTHVDRGFKLKITNGTGTDKTITVRDRLPIPTHDKIKLEVRKIDPTPSERDKENRLTWKLDIKAGQTLEILVDYTLNYPSNESLQYR